MKVGYVTKYDAKDVSYWSGLEFYISKALENQGLVLDYLGPLVEKNKRLFQCKQGFYKYLLGKKHLRDYEPSILHDFADQISHKLAASTSDVVLSATGSPVAYLECKQPIVFWADAVFASLVDFYPFFSNLTEESIADGNATEASVLDRCSLAIYSSQWAANAAISAYGVSPEKVTVVPFGANITVTRNIGDIKAMVNARPLDKCKLLFLGYEWVRKGGDLTVEVVRHLNEAGLETELTVVGCEPDIDKEIEKWVKVVGFVSKTTKTGRDQIDRLIAESHFLIVPSRAECYGIVFCEANSFGVPCLSTDVGGISTIINDGVNGQLFDLEAEADEYSKYIFNLFENYPRYKQLAISSFKEYETRLNWDSAGRTVKKLLEEVA